MATEVRPGTTLADDEFVAFSKAGDPVKGEFHCSACGYGVTVYRELPRCPMCSGASWQAAPWSPFRRAGSAEPR